MTDPNVEAVISKLRERSEKGVKEYGVTTAEAGLSALEWAKHYQEEMIDGAVYAEALIRALEGRDG